jgi:hypothetical protein
VSVVRDDADDSAGPTGDASSSSEGGGSQDDETAQGCGCRQRRETPFTAVWALAAIVAWRRRHHA